MFRIFIFVFALTLIPAASFANDEFGPRFVSASHRAFEDPFDASAVLMVEPAAGGERLEEADVKFLPQSLWRENISGRVYPSAGLTVEIRDPDH